MTKIKNCIIIMMLIASIGTANAATQELIKSQYPSPFNSFGDQLYKITYNDGTIGYSLVRAATQKLYIGSVLARVDVPVGGDPSGSIKIPVSLQGLSCSLGVGGSHEHQLDFYYTPQTSQHIGGLIRLVGCGELDVFTVAIPNSYFGGQINSPGDYELVAKETVTISGSPFVSTETRLFTLRVAGIASTPTLTPTPTSGGSYIRVTSNIAGAVYIDGATVGITGNTFSVSPGSHDIKVMQSGYSTYSTSVTVDYGATATVSAVLNPSATTTATATVTATATATATATGTPTPTPKPSPVIIPPAISKALPGFESLITLIGLAGAISITTRKKK